MELLAVMMADMLLISLAHAEIADEQHIHIVCMQ